MTSKAAKRVALITGANRGTGFETAKQLGRRGFHVILAARDNASGRKAAEAVTAEGGSAEFLMLGVRR
ncbi:SDR family NAD(P)-dependent oxidoreductase [Lacipirellula sp.]|uniref:SDR family NAD(P)-dependent oxidoreductase n=1 Tax=Lacipirellula sp. TaxID=2691419 RepID=UPI003D0E3564